jgi:hypothetical protein
MPSPARRAVLLFSCFLAAPSLFAQGGPFSMEEIKAAQKDPGKYTIDEKTIVVENLGPTVSPRSITPPADTPPGGGSIDPSVIINIATKVWDIIVKNKPVVDVQNQYAVALPQGITNWGQLAGWKQPQGTVYGFYAKNTYGQTVIDVRYQVLRIYGGNYKGKGKYLTAVTVEPLRVDVLWGYKFTLKAEVPDSSIINVGSTEDPLAGMTATLKWRIETAIKDSQGKSVYYLQGDGFFKELGGPFNSAARQAAEKVARFFTIPWSSFLVK